MMCFFRYWKGIFAIPVSFAYLLAIPPLPTSDEYNYGEALQKSIIFYEAQQAGTLPEWNRVPWRGDSVLEDGSDVGIDLSGGWFDAGDHIKFGLPMANTVTMLSWGGIEYYEAFEQSNQLIHLERNLQWATDYLLKAFANDTRDQYVLYAQVGSTDEHQWWGPAEVTHYQMTRPSSKIDTQCPGSDLAAETSAALASSSILFRRIGNNSYADLLVEKAEKLYDFADRYRGNYSDCVAAAAAAYKTYNGHQDDIVWGAIWLHKAKQAQNAQYSGNYLAKAISEYPAMDKPYDYTIGYDDKSYGVYVLLAQETGDLEYQERAEAWLDFWTIGYQGKRVTYTPEGLAFLNKWGSLVGSSITSFVGFIYSDWLREQGMTEKADRYRDFGFSQINYILGNNGDRRSYIVGFGNNFPRNPHHRTAHGSWNDSKEPAQNRNLIIGALVGGPDEHDRWEDNRDDYIRNEVALNYNSGLVGALARMYLEFGGEPLAKVIYPESQEPGIYLETKIQQKNRETTDIRTIIVNKSYNPALVLENATLRLFFAVNNNNVDSLLISAISGDCNLSSPSPVKVENNLYYVEIACPNSAIYPGNDNSYTKQLDIRVANRDRNPQVKEILSQPSINIAIALYNNGELISGDVPIK